MLGISARGLEAWGLSGGDVTTRSQEPAERQMGLEAGVRASQLFSSTFPDPEAEFTTWQEPDKAQRAREGTRQVSPGQVTYKHDGGVDAGAVTAMPQSCKSLHTSDKMHQRTLTDGLLGAQH